jgi:hypothetical protein
MMYYEEGRLMICMDDDDGLCGVRTDTHFFCLLVKG